MWARSEAGPKDNFSTDYVIRQAPPPVDPSRRWLVLQTSDGRFHYIFEFAELSPQANQNVERKLLTKSFENKTSKNPI
jgi:hypothetical protein